MRSMKVSTPRQDNRIFRFGAGVPGLLSVFPFGAVLHQLEVSREKCGTLNCNLDYEDRAA